MSSTSAESGRAARLRRPGTWTLRTRLLAALMAVLAAVILAIGVVSVLALSGFLQGQLDDQLDAAVGRSRAYGGPPSGESNYPNSPGDDPPGFLSARGQAEGTLGAVIVNGSVVRAATIDRDGNPIAVPSDASAVLTDVPPDGRPHTVDLGAGRDDYRVLALTTDTGEVMITGLPLRSVAATLLQLTLVITALALAGLLVAAAAGAAIIRLALRPLQRVTQTASRVAELPLDRGAVALAERVADADTDPRTEVGQVGAALNRMLGHVAAALTARELSETRVRQFVGDASHELRTPLASIRGYAELTRRSRTELPPEVAHALSRVESEAIRMSVLVDELLLLARLDTGRAVQRAEVDLSRLIVDAVGDAHAAGPEHHWALDLPDVPVSTIGDGATLHQMVANLLANARVHTPPGSSVTVELRCTPGAVELRVIDDGPGIPIAQQPQIFDRFARGDSSRSRAAGSTGLGLSIVAAVVAAHHGTVEVASSRGSTAFTVTLPNQSTHSDRTAAAHPVHI